MRCFVCLFACLCSGVAAAAGLPEAVLPQGVGVNIHFTRGHERDLDMIAAAGFKFIRMDFSWSATERSIGQYDFSAYDELTDGLAERGIRPLYILDYSNALYEATITAVDPISGSARRSVRSPQRPESVAAFARWAGAAAAHFRDRGVVWEIWNEPNIGFWKPEPNVDQYIALARATCGEIRQNDPHATIVAPASSAFPWEFFERLFASGILEQIDAVSVHPYRGSPPETATADYLRLRALIARCAPPERRSLPILSGEWGYSTNTDGIPLARQAEYLARQQLINLLCDVRLSIWYDWVNDGPDPHEREHNFGTVANDRTPKPSYVAVQTLTRELAGYRIARRGSARGRRGGSIDGGDLRHSQGGGAARWGDY